MIDVNLYRGRRLRLAEQMGRGVAVLSTAPERLRNRDAHYPYRFDSYFHYLTGFAEPEAVLVVVAGDEVKSLLFCRDKHEEREIWDGFRYGPAGRAGGVRLRRGALDHQRWTRCCRSCLPTSRRCSATWARTASGTRA